MRWLSLIMRFYNFVLIIYASSITPLTDGYTSAPGSDILMLQEGVIYRPPADDESRSSDALKAASFNLFYVDSIVDITNRHVHPFCEKDYVPDSNIPGLVPDQVPNSTAAYTKCFNSIDIASIDGKLSPERYVTFVNDIVGIQSFDLFRNLPTIFVLIFYSTACTSNTTGQNCQVGANPAIDAKNLDDRLLLCNQILKTITTEMVTTFRYTINYNTTQVSIDNLSKCLEDATENLLFDKLAGCKIQSEPERILSERVRLVVSDENTVSETDHVQLQESNEGNDRGSLSYHSQCRYLIQSKTDAILQLPCITEQTLDAANGNQTIQTNVTDDQCGFVSSTINITTHQLVEPSDTALRIRAVQVLRESIDGGTFMSYLSDDCLSV